MNISPYTLYIDKRPLRIAFLINPRDRKFNKLTEKLIGFNQTKWGGRYNPIILTDGISISDEYWKLLSQFDPDYILGLTPIRNDLIRRIDSSLSPLYFEVLERRNIDLSADQGFHPNIDPISIYPTKENMIEVSRTLPLNNPTCINFTINNLKNPQLKRFVKYNFGTYSDLFPETYSLLQVQNKTYRLINIDSLVDALSEITQIKPYEITYPIQFCSLPNYYPEGEFDPLTMMFTVIVGNSPNDISYHWNRILKQPKWKRTSLNQLWLPTQFAHNRKLQDAIRSWLENIVDTFGPTGHSIHFLSFSLDKSQLDNIAKILLPNGCVSYISALNNPSYQKIKSESPFANTSRMKNTYTFTSSDIDIPINEPNLLLAIENQGYWMNDIYVKLPIKYNNILGRTYWLQLPRKNNLAHQLVNDKQTRINSFGIPSILLHTSDVTISIELPDLTNIIRKLLIEQNLPSLTADVRYDRRITGRKYYRAELSDKGKYFNGFLNLFEDVSQAYMILAIPFWRFVFDRLSRSNTRLNDHIERKISNTIKKMIKKSPPDFLHTSVGLDFLTDLTLKQSEIQSQNEFIVSKKFFTEYAVKEFKSKTPHQQQQGEDFYLRKDIIERYISFFLKRNILLGGFRPRCKACGSANWYHIDEVSQHMICKGCRNEITISSNDEWYYKLNNLFRMAIIQGCIPVLMVLGELLRTSKYSFYYFPSAELFWKRTKQPDSELDIICIQDGKFIIGEVKKKARDFNKQVFDTLEKVSIKIKPDCVICSSLDSHQPPQYVQTEIDNLKSKLQNLNIDIKWYPLRDIY